MDVNAYSVYSRLPISFLRRGFWKNAVRIITDPHLKDLRNSVWTCGGSRLRDYLVITSAACAMVEPKFVAFGMIDTKANFSSDCVTAVVETFLHPSFSLQKNWKLHDVALLRTEKPMKRSFECRVPPDVFAVIVNYDEALETPGTYVTVMGWGASNIKNQSFTTSDLIRYTEVQIAEFDECFSLEKKPSRSLVPSAFCSVKSSPLRDDGLVFNVSDRHIYFNNCTNNTARDDGSFNLERQNAANTHSPPIGTEDHVALSSKPTDNAAQFDVEIADMLGLRQGIKGKKQETPHPAQPRRTKTRSKPEARRQGSTSTSTLRPLQAGICVNDHGGPVVKLLTRSILYIVGLNTAFKLRKSTRDCVGPFWYTSAAKNYNFIYCTAKKMGLPIRLHYVTEPMHVPRSLKEKFICDQTKLKPYKPGN